MSVKVIGNCAAAWAWSVRQPVRPRYIAPMRLPDNDDNLEEDFPLGDGTADTGSSVSCPYCGEVVEIGIDPGSGEIQDYVEDCPVCCQPWRVSVRYDREGQARVTLETID